MQKITDVFNWEEFNIAALEKKHDITAKAKRDGGGNVPPTNSETFTVAENEIKQECDTFIERHIHKLRSFLKNIEEKQNELSSYLKQNHFEPLYDKLKLNFDALSGKTAMTLGDYKNSFDTFTEEKRAFQRQHQRIREPNFAKTSNTIKAFGLVIFLLVIEVVANSTLLSGALVGGQAEGFALAATIAFINVFISFIVGYYICKNLTHLEKSKKIAFGLLSSLFLLFIVYLNSCLGAYRSLSKEAFDKLYAVDENIQKLSDGEVENLINGAVAPWNVDFGFTGLVLTFLGISFAFLSLLDGFFYNDTYPGYGKTGQKADKYDDLIKKEKHLFAERVKQLLDEGNNDLQRTKDRILNTELNNWDSNTNLIQKEFIGYQQKVQDVEEKGKHIINEYRAENKRVRKTDAPNYFKKDFKVSDLIRDPKSVFTDVAFHYMDDQSREKKKIDMADWIEDKFKFVEKEFEDLVKLTEERQREFNEKFNTH